MAHGSSPERSCEYWSNGASAFRHRAGSVGRGFVVTDLARARRFYDAIARPLGLATRDLNAESFLLGRGAGQVPYLWIGTTRPSYWAPESKPGINQMHVEQYYGAFVLDPDGNNIEACFRD